MTAEEIKFTLSQLEAYFAIKVRDGKDGNVAIELYEKVKELEKALERSTGHWIEHNKFNNAEAYYLECSECGYITYQDNPNYCEDCGAKMIEAQEESHER